MLRVVVVDEDNERRQVLDRAYSVSGLVERIAGEDLETNDIIFVLQERLGYRLEESSLEIGADGADRALVRGFGIADGAPVLRINFTSMDINGVPVLYTEFVARAERFAYRINVRR